jgi:8-oxo-dGTP pyrophosphatase MutT (NUDIX family)
MGHIEPNETATQCAIRELTEELGLAPSSPAFLDLWALEEVHPYFLASSDAIMLSPRFAAEVTPTWTPTLNEEHSAHRWVQATDLDQSFLWPGQRAACREVLTVIIPATPASQHLRLHHRL